MQKTFFVAPIMPLRKTGSNSCTAWMVKVTHRIRNLPRRLMPPLLSSLEDEAVRVFDS